MLAVTSQRSTVQKHWRSTLEQPIHYSPQAIMSNSNSTFQSYSSSYSSSSVNGRTKSTSETVHSDPTGTRVHRTVQNPGQAPQQEHFEVDNSGKKVEGARASDSRRIEDVTDHETDKNYKEKMEDEYAKREGGA